MKSKKISSILLIVIICCLPTFSQSVYKARNSTNISTVNFNELEKALNIYQKSKSIEEHKNVLDTLENISKKESKNWLALYWASYISAQIYGSSRSDITYLDKSQKLFDKAEKVYSENSQNSAKPYFHALQSLIYMFRTSQYARLRDRKNYNLYNEKAKFEVEKGLLLDSQNPVLMVLAVTTMGLNNKNISEILAAISMLEKAQDMFKKITNRSPSDITYWNEKWISSWLARTKSLLNVSTFKILPVTEKVKSYAWIKLAEDLQNDGRSKNSADGKAFSYFYEKDADMLWFKFDLYNQININNPAVSVSFDTDANQQNGINWYGTNKEFKYEKMISVGPTQKVADEYIGYNGITDEKGVQQQNWINVKKGVAKFYFDKETNSYFLGVKRNDIEPDLREFNVIGSVGQNAIWNDDIGEKGHSKIKLNIKSNFD